MGSVQALVEPEARVVPIRSAPPIPPSLKLTSLKDPNSLESAEDYPVIVWGDYTYWPLSYRDNRFAMCLVAYDLVNEVVHKWEELAGARYVVTVTVDKSRQEITLLGQSSATVTLSWNEIGSIVPKNPQYFWILNQASRLACRTTPASYIRLDTMAVTDDQLWLLDDGRQAIFPKIGSPDICFDHHEAPDHSILVTLAQTNWGRTQQRWIINTSGNLKPAAINLLATVSILNSVVLQVPSATAASNNQLWYMKPYVPAPDLSTDQFPHLIPGESFMLSNTDQILSSNGSGPLTLVDANYSSSTSALWFHNRSGGVLVNAQDGLTITASGASSVVASSWTGGPEQQWALTAHGYLVCRANGLLMVARGKSLVLVSYNALGPSDQIWSLQFQQALQAATSRARRDVNPGASRDNIITQLTVTARVSDEFWAGTSDKIFISFGSSKRTVLLFDGPARGDVVTVTVDLNFMFEKAAVNLRDDVNFIWLGQEGLHPIASDAWKLDSIILKAKDEANNLEFTNSTFQKVDQWLDNHSPAFRIVWSNPIPWGAWLDANQKPVDLNGNSYPVGWIPCIGDILSWREYDPSKIDGVGQILGMRNGRLIGELLKPPRKTEVLQPSDDRHSYTWVFTPQGAIIYKLWDKQDLNPYIRHSQLGSGSPVICAGEMQMNNKVMNNYVVTDVIAMVNDASGHYKPDGGACLRYVGQKLQELGIPTDKINWYSR